MVQKNFIKKLGTTLIQSKRLKKQFSGFLKFYYLANYLRCTISH